MTAMLNASLSIQTADYMVSFMDYVDPSKKMLECRLQAKIRGVKRPIGVTVLPDQSVVVSSSGDTNEVKIIRIIHDFGIFVWCDM